jgi:hypothetical protein
MCPAKAIGTEFLALREKIEATRHESTCESVFRCRWGGRIAHTRAPCAVIRGEGLDLRLVGGASEFELPVDF